MLISISIGWAYSLFMLATSSCHARVERREHARVEPDLRFIQLRAIQVERRHAAMHAIQRERFRQIRETRAMKHAVEPEAEIVDDVEVGIVADAMLLHELTPEHGARIGQVRSTDRKARLDVRVVERKVAREMVFVEMPDLRADDSDIRMRIEKHTLLSQPVRLGDVVVIDARDVFAAAQVERPIRVGGPPLIVFEREYADS
jgi:hypothetical protein